MKKASKASIVVLSLMTIFAVSGIEAASGKAELTPPIKRSAPFILKEGLHYQTVNDASGESKVEINEAGIAEMAKGQGQASN